ncbi:glycosyltransferase, partial [Xanthovirga aplysinae]|uniref:glycosyltransferase n=1 Tax=Xanthovirga aplysinae TaxID=2529853 RepID=UPI0012BBB239
ETSFYFTVLIPVRNEEKHILNLLQGLNGQTYPSFEVIIINDSSEDETLKKIRGFVPQLNFPLKLIHLDLSDDYKGSHKKKAITLGVECSSGEIIVCTDGDCLVQKDWLATLDSYWNGFGEKLQFVSGGVTFQGERNFFEQLQTIEFASLIGAGAASMQLGAPNMCNGANLSFRKSAFIKINGYEGVDHIASGDDEFLMQKINRAFPGQLGFLKHSSHVVSTWAKSSIKEFMHQRRRWASKWSFHKNIKVQILAILVLLYHLGWIAQFVLLIFGLFPPSLFLFLLLLKSMAEFLFLKDVLGFMEKRLKKFHFLILQILYSFYVVLIGIAANFGSYQWKGREINPKNKLNK